MMSALQIVLSLHFYIFYLFILDIVLQLTQVFFFLKYRALHYLKLPEFNESCVHGHLGFFQIFYYEHYFKKKSL